MKQIGDVGNHFQNQDFIIAVDESEKEDIFVFGHVILSKKQATILQRKWLSLQSTIKSKLLIRLGEEKLAKKLKGNEFPEIHAENLCQSTGCYRWADAPNKEYWKEQFTWLEEALKIIRHVSPQLLFATEVGHRENAQKIISAIKEDIIKYKLTPEEKEERELEEIYSLLTSPYAKNFSGVILELDLYMQHTRRNAKLICDNYDQCKGYSNLELYNIAKEHNLMTHLTAPDFLSSEEEILLQVADVCAYVYTQYQYYLQRSLLNEEYKKDYKFYKFKLLTEKYLLPLEQSKVILSLPFNQKIVPLRDLMFWELVSKKLPNNSEFKEYIQLDSDIRIRALLPPK